MEKEQVKKAVLLLKRIETVTDEIMRLEGHCRWVDGRAAPHFNYIASESFHEYGVPLSDDAAAFIMDYVLLSKRKELARLEYDLTAL
jgi:hypothetical protein